MTREMNKPDWCSKHWASIHCTPLADKCYICGNDICKYRIKERKLDDWIKPFVDSVNERFKQCGKQ